jgi:hypothetical protein
VSDLSVMYRADVSIMKKLCHYQYARYSQSAKYADVALNALVPLATRIFSAHRFVSG